MTTKSSTPFRCALGAALLLFGVAGSALVAGDEYMRKVGKKAGVTLSTDTMVGDQMLEAGHYQVRHRTEGDGHFVKFTRIDGKQRIEIDIKCRLEPESRKVVFTSLAINNAGPTPRVTKIAIQGETASHWLAPSLGMKRRSGGSPLRIAGLAAILAPQTAGVEKCDS